MELNKNEQDYLVQKIRTQYTEKQHTELDELKALDKKVKRPVNVFAYLFGSLGALVMGAGMSLIMTDLSTTLNLPQPLIPGLVLGILGLLIALLNYPIYKTLLASRRKKFAPQIIALSDKLSQP